MKAIPLSVVSLLVVWLAAAGFIEYKTNQIEKEYQEKRALTGQYESLKRTWSEKSQKRALKKFETMLRLYRVTPTIQKRHGQKIFTFTLEKKNADTVLNKLLNSNLAISLFRVRRIDDQHLEVKVGVSI